MNASSQTPAGALPPESPVPHSRTASPLMLRPAPVEWPAAAAQASPAVSPVRAATGVLEAAMKTGPGTPAALAQAEEAAGLLFSPERAEAIASAARAQVREEYRLDIAERGRQLALLADQNRTLRERVVVRDQLARAMDAILRLVDGRPGTDLLTVQEILAATDGTQPTNAPLVIRWDGLVMGPSGDTEGENTLVPCTTARGGQAALVLDDEQRQALASLLGAKARARHELATADRQAQQGGDV